MPIVRVPVLTRRPLDTGVKLSGSARLEPLAERDARGAQVVFPLQTTTPAGKRAVVDRVVFVLRLWRPGRFACPCIVVDGHTEWPARWYDRPWTTWRGSPVERPLDWQGATGELPDLWKLASSRAVLGDHRLRRFGHFYFCSVAVDRFSMLFMAADGLLFPFHGGGSSNSGAFGERGARMLAGLLPQESEAELKRELIRYYKRRNGEFHGTARTSGAQIQGPAERMELFVRHLLLYLMRRQLLTCPEKAEAHIRGLG